MHLGSLSVVALLSLSFVGCETQTRSSPPPSSEEELETFVRNKMEQAGVPGLAACVVRGEMILWCAGYGLAVIEDDLAVTPDTPFLWASISKLVTTVAVMQMVEEGVVALDDPIERSLSFPVTHPQHSQPITYRQLLSHVGSVEDGDALDDYYTLGADPTISLEDAMSGYFSPEGQWYDAEANFGPSAPGAAYRYSNVAFALLGYAVEAERGQPFDTYCDTEIFAQAGMASTSWRLAGYDRAQIAMPYERIGNTYVPYGHYTFADYPNGGARGSARDMARFLIAASTGGPLLAEDSVDTMLEVHFAAQDPGQSLGWATTELGGDTWIGHSGGEDGVATDMYLRERDGLGFVVLMNGDWPEDESPIQDIELALVAFAQEL